MAHSEYFLEAVSQFANTDDIHSDAYLEALAILEGTGTEKKNMMSNMRKDIGKWFKASRGRNEEIFESGGDITKIIPDIREVASVISKNEISIAGMKDTLKNLSALYEHFNRNKAIYMKAVKLDSSKTFGDKDCSMVAGIYYASVWTMVSYLAEAIVSLQGKKTRKLDKYAKWIADTKKYVGSPTYVEWMGIAEKSHMNTESVLFENPVLAAGAVVIGGLTLVRLITWNIYNMRTKLSDKLKVTAEYMEKNAKRLSNTNRKNKDKIVARQLKSVDVMNRLAELFRIKTDEDKLSSPPKLSAPSKKDDSSPSTSDDDDFEL